MDHKRTCLQVVALAVLCTLALSTKAKSANTVILNYDDFRPQVIANSIIGMQWWQWQPQGDSRPTTYNIKVVVYHNTPLATVKARYPVISEKQQDYRYVGYPQALSYLDQHITDNLIPSVTLRLQQTKRLLQHQMEK